VGPKTSSRPNPGGQTSCALSIQQTGCIWTAWMWETYPRVCIEEISHLEIQKSPDALNKDGYRNQFGCPLESFCGRHFSTHSCSYPHPGCIAFKPDFHFFCQLSWLDVQPPGDDKIASHLHFRQVVRNGPRDSQRPKSLTPGSKPLSLESL
jgi:hypothetical protein